MALPSGLVVTTVCPAWLTDTILAGVRLTTSLLPPAPPDPPLVNTASW